MIQGSATTYRVFVRTWWARNPAWPNGLRPEPGRQRTIAKRCTEDEARAIAKAWNATHSPGRLSRKAEYTRE